MRISVYYNDHMYLIQDAAEPKDRLVPIDESNIGLVEGSCCLYENNASGYSLLGEFTGSATQCAQILQQKLGAALLETVFLPKGQNDHISFGVSKLKLKAFFEKYKVAEIHPMQYILKSLNDRGITGIVSSDFGYYKEFRPNVPLSSDTNVTMMNIYGIVETMVGFNKTKTHYEAELDAAIKNNNILKVCLFSALGELNINNVNVEYLTFSDIEKAIEGNKFKIVDTISSFYKTKIVHRRLIFANLFLIAGAIALGSYYFTNEITVRALDSEINRFNSNIASVQNKIEDLNQQLPKINFERFKIDSFVSVLNKYTKYSPTKIGYKFKGNNEINVFFIIDDAFFAEKLIEELNEKKIKYKYKKGTGYTFEFNIDEKITAKDQDKKSGGNK